MEVKEAVQAFGENLMERENKNMAKIKNQEEQQDIDTLTKEKSELADMLKELERIEADDAKRENFCWLCLPRLFLICFILI